MSATGQYICATTSTGSIISSNYGASWSSVNTNGPNYYYNLIAMSATGQYIIGSGTTFVTYSKDYGVTWTNTTISSALSGGVPSTNFAISSNGQYWIIIRNTGTVHYSVDYGATIRTSTATFPSTSYFFGVGMSSNAQYITIVSMVNGIYTSATPYINLFSSNQLTTYGDASFNSRLYIGSDASFGGKLFVSGDSSMNGNLSLAKDLTVTGNLYVNTYSTRQTITTLSYEFFVTQDISATGRLFMGSDASFLGRVNNIVITAPVGISTLTLAPGTTFSTAGSVAHTGAFAQTLVGTAATSITLPTTGTLATLAGTETFTNKTLTAPTFTTPTLGAATATSINSLTVTNAAATLTLAASSTFSTAGSVAHAGAFARTLTATAATSITLPTAGTLATLAGTETLSRKTFTGDISMTNRLIVSGDVSFNSRLLVGTDASVNGRLFLNSNSLFVNGALFTGGSNNFAADVSMNSRLYVGSDISGSGNLFVKSNSYYGNVPSTFNTSSFVLGKYSGGLNYRYPGENNFCSVSTFNGYTVLTFTKSTTFSLPFSTKYGFLVVGSGGAGNPYGGTNTLVGGGGGGGVCVSPYSNATAPTFPANTNIGINVGNPVLSAGSSGEESVIYVNGIGYINNSDTYFGTRAIPFQLNSKFID
jgi:hypothetical protein